MTKKSVSMSKRDSWDVDDPIDVDDLVEESVYIDVEDLAKEAREESMFMIKDLSKIYGNEEFMREHPDYKKRIDIELESIRMLIKMRKSDEIAHDILLKRIGMNPDNASMYSALNKLQSSILGIQTKLDETIKNVNNLLKNYQLEIPFAESATNQEGDSTDIADGVYRGSKAFIEAMQDQVFEDETADQESSDN